MILIIRYEHTSNTAFLNKLVKLLDNPDIQIASGNYCGPLPGNTTPGPRATNFVGRVIVFLLNQARIAKWIFWKRKAIERIIFFTGGSTLVIPIIMSKVLGIRSVLVATGSASKSYLTLGTTKFNLESRALLLVERLNYRFCDVLVVESPSIVEFLGIANHASKIQVASLAVEETFTMKIPYKDRQNVVGYVGRLNQEKGIFNLVESLIHMPLKDYRIIVVGEGGERDKITRFIKDHNLEKQVLMTGFASREQIVDHLNSFKLLVLPSYTEGLPNAMLEAMACGTPVLATPVGGVPDVIDDGANGFLLKNNSPLTIASRMNEVISNDNLDEVSKAAMLTIRKRYSQEICKEQWRNVLTK